MAGLKGFMTIALTWLALLAIRGYQRWLSPYKGFHCAYRVYHSGSEGCSGYGRRVIGRYGVFTGYRLLQRRMGDCSAAAERLREQRRPRMQITRSQAGECDGCDLPSVDCDFGDVLSLVGDCAPSCSSSSSGCGSSRTPTYKRRKKYQPLPKKI